jgi:hypothetical protein
MMVHDDTICIKSFIKINRKLEENADANQWARRYKATFLPYRIQSDRKNDSF